jgi:pimeloyl-ACP methyl ester carboxylesterase
MPFLDFRGFKIFYRKMGVKTSLPPLIFIHGAWANHLTWFKQFRYFAKYTEIYAYDLLGHGQSDKPRVEYTAELYAEILRALITQLAIVNPILIGHSLGGGIAQFFALKYPDQVQKLVLLCTGVYLSLGGGPLKIHPAVLRLLRKLFSKMRWSAFVKIMSKMSAKRRIEGIEGINLEARMAATCSGKAMLSMVYYLMQYNISKQVGSLKLPILFITGTKDTFFNQIPIYRALPNAEVKVKIGGEHVLHLFNGEVDNWILEFIKK